MGIAHVELPVSLLNPPAAPASVSTTPSGGPSSGASGIPVVSVKKDAKKKHHLTTATDPSFAELRDTNFAAVGKKLNKVARRLDEDYKAGGRDSLRDSGVVNICYRQTCQARLWHNSETSSGNWEVCRLSTKLCAFVSEESLVCSGS